MRISRELQVILNASMMNARERKHEFLTPEHILFASLHFEQPRVIISGCGAEPDRIRQDVDRHLRRHIPMVENRMPIQSQEFQSVVERAVRDTESSDKDEVSIGRMLVSIFDEDQSFGAYFMRHAGITRFDLLHVISHDLSQIELRSESLPVEQLLEESEESGTEDAEASETPPRAARARRRDPLAMFTTDLTALARAEELEPLIGRAEILERTMQVLCRRLKNNPIHLGDPGVGKTAITEGLATLIASGKAPAVLRNYSILSLDVGGMLAGTRYRGDFEARLKHVIAALEKREDVILFIDEIHTIVGAGAVSGGSMDASNMLKPALAAGRIRCIGSTTHEEYKRYFEKDRALSRRFQKIEVPEPSEADTVAILQGVRARYEAFHTVHYSEEALQIAAHLSALYINDRYLPDKAIDVIDECGANVRMRAEDTPAQPIEISASEIERVVAHMAKIPERSVSSSEKEQLRSLGSDLRRVIFGQDHAIDMVVEAVKRSRAGFRTPNKPVASFLFVGPTGVGKTETARQLAESLGVALHRFDMSEFQEKHTVSRLIGSPPGYVGFEEGALLTDAVRRAPHAVLLLDEIEKAHPDIQSILLQIMDYATITDNAGKKADFRNVVVIMTSNAGARQIGKPIVGFGEKTTTRDVIDDAVERIFSPEFRGRLDRVVLFRALSQEVVENIVRKEIAYFTTQLAERNVKLQVTDACVELLARLGFSEDSGARNVARLVDEKLKSWFVDEVLFGRLAAGGRAVADAKEDTVVIRARRTTPRRTTRSIAPPTSPTTAITPAAPGRDE